MKACDWPIVTWTIKLHIKMRFLCLEKWKTRAVSLPVSGGVILFSNQMEQAVLVTLEEDAGPKQVLFTARKASCLLILVQCIVIAFFFFKKKDGPQLLWFWFKQAHCSKVSVHLNTLFIFYLWNQQPQVFKLRQSLQFLDNVFVFYSFFFFWKR